MRLTYLILSLLVFISITCHAQPSRFSPCIEARIGNDQELFPLKDKIALVKISDQTFQMKTNTNKPTDDEKKLIIRWLEARDDCYKHDSDWRNRLPASLRSLTENSKRMSDDLALTLYDGKITYGEYARKRDEINSTFLATWGEETRNQQQQQQRAAAATEQANSATRERERMVQICKAQMFMTPGNFGNAAQAASQCDADPQAHLRPKPPTYKCDRIGNSTTCAPQ